MASITPITAFQNTPQNTVSAYPSYVSASCETAALSSGVKYLVIYSAQIGASNTSATGYMRLLHGATEIAQVNAEGPQANEWNGTQCNGFTVITGDGSSTLAFEYAVQSSYTGKAGSMGIVAIPLDSLTLNSDYWFDGTDSSSIEAPTATVGGWDVQRSQPFTLPDAGNYLVLMSNEAHASSTGNTANASFTRFRVAGATIGDEYVEEWENNNDWRSYQIAKLVNLSSGSNTFAIEVGSRTDAEADFRRSRIVVIRAASFDQLIQQTTAAGVQDTDSVNFADLTGSDVTYTPNQTEYVMAIGHVVTGCSIEAFPAMVQIYDTTNTVEYGTLQSGESGNDGGYDSAQDAFPVMPIGCEQLTGARGFRFRYRAGITAGSQTVTVGRDKTNTADVDSTMVLWGLTTATPSGSISGTASGSGTASATVQGTGEVSASSAGIATVAGTVSGSADISGTSAGAGTASADITGLGEVSGSAAGVATASGDVAGSGAIAGTSAGVASASAAVVGDGAISGASAGTGSASATLGGLADVAGSASGTSVATGSLAALGEVSGVSAGTSSVSAAIEGLGEISGSSFGVGSATATVTDAPGSGSLAGISYGSSTATASVFGSGAIAGSADGTSTAAMALAGLGEVAGLAAGTSTAIATVSGASSAARDDILIVMTQRERIAAEVSQRERMAVTFSQRERIAVDWS